MNYYLLPIILVVCCVLALIIVVIIILTIIFYYLYQHRHQRQGYKNELVEPLLDSEHQSDSLGQGKQERKEKSKTGHTKKVITNPGRARQEKGEKAQTEHIANCEKAQILSPKQEEKERNKRIDERHKQEKNDRKEVVGLARTLWTDKYSYTRDLPHIGCRLQKYWYLRERNREQFLQTIAPCSKKCLISLDDLETLDSLTDLYKYLSSLKHPYLQTITKFTHVSGQVSIIQPLFKNGSLRDRIFKDQPTADWGDKYTGKGQSLPPDMIATFGKQILKAVRFLYDVGFPLLGHIHTGNIFMEVNEEGKEVCRLGGYENTLLGYRTLNYKKISEGGHLNKIDVIMFGHVIYQMASGQVLVDVYPSKEEYERVKDTPEVLEVLHFIFDTKWKRSSYKEMLKKVENHEFFKRVHLTESENDIKLTYPLKQLLVKVRKGKPVVVTDQHTTSSDRVEFDFMETTEPYCEIYSERESLAQIGWRAKRVWSKATCAHHGEGLLSLTLVPSTCPIFVHDNIKTLEKLLTAINYPHIQPVHGIHYRKIEEKHVVIMFQPLRARGSIRDIIYECTPLQQWDSKYTERKYTFDSKDIALFGHQILEAVSFLYQLGFPPLGHIHTGNIFVDGDTCRLGGYENTLLGYRTCHYDKYRDHLESIDVIMFGHVIFEMCTGREISTLTPSDRDYRDVRDSDVRKFLKFIFAQEEDEFIHGIDEIIDHDFFGSISSFPGDGTEKSEVTDLSKDAQVLLQKVRKGKPRDQNSAVKRTKNKVQEVLFRQMPWEKLNREKQVEVDVH